MAGCWGWKSEGIGWPGWSDLPIRAQLFNSEPGSVLNINIYHIQMCTGGTYLSWQGGKGTRESLQTENRGRAPGASWERQAWSWVAGSCRRPD